MKISFNDFKEKIKNCNRIQLPNEENRNTLNYSLSPYSDFRKDFYYLSANEYGIVPKEIVKHNCVFKQVRITGTNETKTFYLINRWIVKPYLSKRCV
ncbi:MAG: hypothetical protein J1F35_05995 [Erysipelotrichales bacterium]|nr:hypothetical protein [Erysipelotrichales bacterium]